MITGHTLSIIIRGRRRSKILGLGRRKGRAVSMVFPEHMNVPSNGRLISSGAHLQLPALFLKEFQIFTGSDNFLDRIGFSKLVFDSF